MAVDLGKRKKKTPYIVHDPTFKGYLSDGYFYTDLNEWRTREIFPVNAVNIKKVDVNYRLNPERSFSLLIEKGIDKFKISGNNQELLSDSIDTKQVKKFLLGFEDMTFIAIEENIKDFKKDSILSNKPVITINVQDQSDRNSNLKLYFKPTDLRTRVELIEGVDKERYYGISSERSDEFLIFQTLRLSRILWKIDDFKIKN